MPKNGPRSSASSKLRFIMLEADLADGDFSQITQAITNALKPSAPLQRALIASGGQVATKATLDEAIEEVGVEDVADASDVVESSAPSSLRSKTPRSYKEPKRLDLDLS